MGLKNNKTENNNNNNLKKLQQNFKQKKNNIIFKFFSKKNISFFPKINEILENSNQYQIFFEIFDVCSLNFQFLFLNYNYFKFLIKFEISLIKIIKSNIKISLKFL